jgi:hypothetical protein
MSAGSTVEPRPKLPMTADFGGLVDSENGLVGRRIFIEPDIDEAEQKQLFARRSAPAEPALG